MRSRLAVAVLVLIALVGIAAACSEKKRSSESKSTAPAGVPLSDGGSARLFDTNSERGVVIIADGRDLSAWDSMAEEIARSGFRVVVLPASGDGAATARAAADALLRRGARRIVFVGSGQGSAAALAAAAGDAAGIAILNPTPETAVPAPGGMPAVPSLMMASLADGPSSASAQQLYRAAPEPRTLALYPTKEPAPAVFESNAELKSTLLDFLRKAFEPLSAAAQ